MGFSRAWLCWPRRRPLLRHPRPTSGRAPHHFDNSFEKQREEFARSHTVVGIDQRGHGHSPDDARPFSYEAMAEDTADVIRALRLARADVVGHSDGADVALILARNHPELVRRVVVSGANLRPGIPPEEAQVRLRWSAAQLAEFLPKLEARLPSNFRAEYEAVTPAPVLVIAGDKDLAPMEETAEIYRGLRDARLFIVPGSGHATFSTRPGLVNLAILEFLDTP